MIESGNHETDQSQSKSLARTLNFQSMWSSLDNNSDTINAGNSSMTESMLQLIESLNKPGQYEEPRSIKDESSTYITTVFETDHPVTENG